MSVTLLLLVVLGLSFYLEMTWLSALIAAVVLLLIIANIKLPERPRPVPAGAAEKEEVLTPVIVQDTGEAPYLYPPSFRLKMKPNWRANYIWENAAMGLGFGLLGLMKGGRGDKMK